MRAFALYFILCISILSGGCAKRGAITGGLKDTIPPILISSEPKNYSTNFKGNTIRLTFNEYIKLKNINKQLVVSPPMNRAPTILPLNASRYITIKILDTLQPETTYSFNFGQSIEDNNESNAYPQFKYVFSTGAYVDSLSLRGVVKDAYTRETDNFISVMLYEVNEKFNDSIIYKDSPRYITNTLDSATTFQLENLKAGKYLLVALKDNNNSNRFDPKVDKIGFQKEFISIPNDTLYELELFNEELPFKTFKPVQASANRMLLGYQGNSADVQVEVRNGGILIPSRVTQFPAKDSLQIWHQPIKSDSLQVFVRKENYSENYNVRYRNQNKDSLAIKAEQSGTLSLREYFTLNLSTPLKSIDSEKITVFDKDSITVPNFTTYDTINQNLQIRFEKAPLQNYRVNLLPGAITDFYDQTNDSLMYKLSTKNLSDYGILRLTLNNVRRYPIIVELTNAKGEVLASDYAEAPKVFDFNALEPAMYILRIIYDDNKNRRWDTGSYLQKKQSEEVIYFPEEIDVRANWDKDQLFTLP